MTNQSKIGWTAFKTSERVAVNGEFKKFEIEVKKKSHSLSELFENTEAEILSRQVDTGNPDRDKTLFDHFFSKILNKSKIKGHFTKVSLHGNQGDLELKLSLNGVTRTVPMKLTVNESNISAVGEFDLMKFALGKAYNSLHKACEKLHTGKDGLSKTWKTAQIRLSGVIHQKCP